MRIALMIAGLLVSLVAQPQEIYRWVDKDGIVHYSDQPGAPDAKRMEYPGLSGYEPPGDFYTSDQPAQQQGGQVYDSLVITSPQQSEVFNGVGVSVTVTAELDGPLQPGHTLVYYLNGNRIAGSGGLTAVVSGLDRGTHFLRAAVLDGRGAEMIASPPVTIYVRQTSTQNPVWPLRPPPPTKPPPATRPPPPKAPPTRPLPN